MPTSGSTWNIVSMILRTEQSGHHHRGHDRAEVLHQVEGLAGRPAREQVVADGLDVVLQLRHPPDREHPGDLRAQPCVGRWVGQDHHPGLHLLLGEELQHVAVRRAVGRGVAQRGRDVVVARQRVEPEPLVEVDGRLVAHPPPHVVRRHVELDVHRVVVEGDGVRHVSRLLDRCPDD
jgi:hypothetical protein